LLYEDNFNKTGKPASSERFFRNNKKFSGVSCPENVVQEKSDDSEGYLLIKFTRDITRKANEQYLGGALAVRAFYVYFFVILSHGCQTNGLVSHFNVFVLAS